MIKRVKHLIKLMLCNLRFIVYDATVRECAVSQSAVIKREGGHAQFSCYKLLLSVGGAKDEEAGSSAGRL